MFAMTNSVFCWKRAPSAKQRLIHKWKFLVCSRSVKSDTAAELHVQKPSYLGGKCSVHPLHCGMDLDSPAVCRLTLFHLSAKHLIPPKHPFAFSNTLIYFAYVYSPPPASSLWLRFSFALIYAYIFICTPTHLCLSLPSVYIMGCSLLTLPSHKTLTHSINHSEL